MKSPWAWPGDDRISNPFPPDYDEPVSAPPIQQDSYYYHAGVRFNDDRDDTEWSQHTRYSWDAAVREARRMARRYRHIEDPTIVSVRPIVEYWWRVQGREHGFLPGFEVAEGEEYVDAPDEVS